MTVSVKVERVLCAMWVCVALSASNAVHAQSRAQTPDPPGAATNYIDLYAPGEYVCPAPSGTSGGRDLNWWFEAWNTICTERVRSDAVALAWTQGLDEHGAQLDAAARASKLTELAVWLRRLVGKFHIEGKRWRTGERSEVHGTADCFGIGNGPGVACVIAAEWVPLLAGKSKNPDTIQNYAIRPQILLFGLDPGAMEIRVTHVDAVAVSLHGFLLDGAVILKGMPSLVDFLPNPRIKTRAQPAVLNPFSRVAIQPDGAVDLKFHANPPGRISVFYQPIEFDLQLHREPQVEKERPGDPQ